MTWLRDSAYYFIARALPAAIALVLVSALIRGLGESEYGAYALAFAGTNLVSVLCVGWLSQSALRFQPATQPATRTFQRRLRIGAIGSALACAMVLVPLFLLSDQALRDPLAILAGVLLVSGLTVHAVFAASLQAALAAPTVAAIEVGRALLSLPLAIGFAKIIDPPFAGALLGFALSYLCSAAVAWFASGAQAARVPVGEGSPALVTLTREMFSFGWLVSVWLACSLALPFIERLIIVRVLGVEAAGLYAATYDIVFRSCGFLLLPLVLSLHPRIMRCAVAGDHAGTLRLWRQGMMLQLGITLGIVVVMAMAWPYLLRIAGISVATTGVHLVLPLALAGCLWQMALLAHKLLEASLRPAIMVAVLAVTMLALAVADVVLARTHGLPGVAYALAASGVAYCACVSLLGWRQVRQRIAQGAAP